MLYQPAEQPFERSSTPARSVPISFEALLKPSGAMLLAQGLAVLRRRLRLLLACLVGVPLIVGIGLLRVEPRYTASGTVLYEPHNYATAELQSILRADPITDEVIISQAEIIRSTHSAERLVDRFRLTERPDFNASLASPSLLGRAARAVKSAIDAVTGQHVAPPSAEEMRRAVVERVQAAITVVPLRNSHVLEVTFTSPEADLSAQSVNSLMEFYIADLLQKKFDAVRGANQWLGEQAAQLQKTVTDDERKIAAYKGRAGLTSGMVAGLSAEDVSHLGDQLVQARTELASAESRLDAARGKGGAAAQAAVAPSVQPLRTMAEQLNAQMHSLLTTLGPNMPQMVRLREQVAQSYRAVDAEIARVASVADGDARSARAKVNALQQAVANAQVQSASQTEARVPLDAMQREADASRTLLQSVLAGIQRLSQQAAIERSDASVVSLAASPASPSFPKTGIMLTAAVLFGLCFGLLMVYLLEVSDSTMGSSEDVRRMLGLSCLALVPAVAPQEGRNSLNHGESARRNGGIDDYVVRKPQSHFAEQIRSVRAAFWFGATGSRTVAITSARPAEGKTTTAIALGRSAALNGEKVIVVDCDVRQPSLGEGPGISDFLRGTVKLADVTHRDPMTPLMFVPVGTPADGGGGPFMSEGMTKVLAQLRQEYDLVILDSPPVLAMTDARVIARLADATLLCVRWRDTPGSVAGRSLAMLQDAQAHVAGAILTRIDPRAVVVSGLADAEMYNPRYHGYYRD